jgi:hypothetical protein
MAKKSDLEQYLQLVFQRLRELGHPVDQWQSEIDEAQALHPLAKRRPFTTIQPPAFGKITCLRPGFQEFVKHPVHKALIPRCQAARKRTGGKIQCAKFAIKGRHLCRTHGGAAGSGIQSPEGRQKQIEAVTRHGNETRPKRAQRSFASQKLRELDKVGRELGIIDGRGSRGPYFKPNRVGQPMVHLNRKRKN